MSGKSSGVCQSCGKRMEAGSLGDYCADPCCKRPPASPVPLETMIEETLKDGWVLHGGYSEARPEGQEYVFWLTGAFRDGGTLLEDGPEASGASTHEALEKLHTAWRERG